MARTLASCGYRVISLHPLRPFVPFSHRFERHPFSTRRPRAAILPAAQLDQRKTTGRAKIARPVGVGLRFAPRLSGGLQKKLLLLGGLGGFGSASLSLGGLGGGGFLLSSSGLLISHFRGSFDLRCIKKIDLSLPWHPQWQRSVAVLCVEAESSLISIHYDLDSPCNILFIGFGK